MSTCCFLLSVLLKLFMLRAGTETVHDQISHVKYLSVLHEVVTIISFAISESIPPTRSSTFVFSDAKNIPLTTIS